MPVFHLHLRYHDHLIKDEEGYDLPDVAAARAEARSAVRDIVAEDIEAGRPVLLRSIEVCDEDGEDIATVTVAAAISVSIPLTEDSFEMDLKRYYDTQFNPCDGEECG